MARRIFIIEGREFPDQYPDKSPEDVKNIMTNFYPELANAEVVRTEREGNEYYEFKKRTGVKGS